MHVSKSIMLTGASATGKSTLARYCQEAFLLERIPGHTTRERRIGECHGFDFIYISKEEFLSNFQKGYYCDPSLEVTMYLNNYYGSPWLWVSQLDDTNKMIIFTPTSVITADFIKNERPEKIFWVHLYTDNEEREERLKERNISKKEILYRLRNGDSHGVVQKAHLNINTAKLNPMEALQHIYAHS
jgi:guanylate kinase